MKKKLKIGIFGLDRGAFFFPAIQKEGGEVVAFLEKDDKKIENAKIRLQKIGENTDNIGIYKDFDQFIKHDMDCVLLANYYNEHAKYAIKCLENNVSVLSETMSNATMAEGVALVRAVEKSKAKYMLLENYPFMKFNLEIKKVINGGTLGKPLYCEGEYNHPSHITTEHIRRYYGFDKHWRRFLPRTYYLTHALAPLMYITGARPTRVCALPIYHPDTNSASMVGDIASIMTTINDDKSVFKFSGHTSYGYEENSYRFCCEKGQVQNCRGDENKILVAYNDWDIPEGKEKVNIYDAEWEEQDKEIAAQLGHAGGDYFVIKNFFGLLRGENENPYDVYFATTMASISILAHRSQIELGVPYDVPDFRKEDDRKKYENDYSTPFYDSDGGVPNIQCCSNKDYRPTEEALKNYYEMIKN